MPHPRISKKPEGQLTRGKTSVLKIYGLRQWFVHAAEAPGRKGYRINLQKKFLSWGNLVWELIQN
jgi:hypothetical protein